MNSLSPVSNSQRHTPSDTPSHGAAYPNTLQQKREQQSVPGRMIASSERQIWPLTGGVHPEENKHQSTGRPIAKGPLPKQLILPLAQHAGSPADPVVSVSDTVLKGQLIARPTGFVSAPVHAPSSGRIIAIEKRPIPHASGFHDTCIVLETDGEDRWCELFPTPDFRQETPEALVQKIRDAGISGMGGAGFPTAIKMVPATPITTLVLNGSECEPYITADDMLMRERADDILKGAEILQHLLQAEVCLIGIEDNKPEAIQAMRLAAGKFLTLKKLDIVVFPTAYPSGGEKQLIKILTGQEVPSGKLPTDLGMVVQNVGTAVAVKEAIIDGRPLISRITTLTGNALAQPQNMEVLLGTRSEDLLTVAGLQQDQLATLVVGGSMMGFTLNRLDTPVIKTTNCLIAGGHDEFPPSPPAQACIRCGMCAEACPASLLPQQLYWHAKAENHDQLMHHNLFDCIECGACSYVCPSSIPLVQYYRASKGAIRNQEAKHAKSERSRVRYENRLARLEQEKAEKEAKRKANAARAAKLKAAKAQTNSKSSSTPEAKTEEDPVQAAIARAKARKASAAGQQKPTGTARPILSPEQKERKIQLSMAKAQLKKTEQALVAEEGRDNPGEERITALKANLQLLNEQVSTLQKAFDQSSEGSATQPPQDKPAKQARSAVSDEEKKRKVEMAMARAALKKAERAPTQAVEQNSEITEALQQQVK
ncbi:MAG: electron transport complex subunit RsxC [Endozoicomonas sp.]